MKLASRQSLLLIAVVLILAVNIVWRYLGAEPQSARRSPASPATLMAAANDIAPSLSNLASMGREWQLHIAALPPEARAASAAKLQAEKQFFTQVALLPAEERQRQMRARLEALMNDPEIQAVMMEERVNKFARLDSSSRQKLLKGYVNYKSQVTGR